MADGTREPRAYELMTVFVPDMQDDAGPAQVDRVAGYITGAGGDLTETLTDSPWGRRRLAYTIRFNGVDYRDGVYTVYHFQSAPNAISTMERDLKLDTSTMRYLLVHDDPKTHEKFDPNAVGEDGEPIAAAGGTAPAPAAAPAPVAPPTEPEVAATAAAAAPVETVAAAPADSSEDAPSTDAAPVEDAPTSAAETSEAAPAVEDTPTDMAEPADAVSADDETPADAGDTAEASDADKE